jgi:nucleoside-diphosphate-sugar epimerase
VDFLASIRCGRFVGAGTCLEYDTSGGVLSEESPAAPQTVYARTKHEAFVRTFGVTKRTGMSFGWLRFFYQYGPFEHPARLVPNIILPLLRGDRAAPSPGVQVRDFLHIEDVGSAVASAAVSEVQGAVNIGSGDGVTVKEIVQTIAELCGAEDRVDFGALPQRPGDPLHIVAENDRLRSTGWEPRYTLRNGLAQTVDWWRENQPLPLL